MKILFLAPQPFYQERGTPIAVRLALRVLAERGKDQIDLLTYHEGETISLPHLSVHRIPAPSWLKGVGPGLSAKKLLCDIIFIFSAIRLVWRARKEQYALVHAVEEAVFIALLFRWILGIPYIYDMDSSLALQVTEKWVWLKPLAPVLEWFERLAVRSSMAVVPVCDALAAIAVKHGSRDTQVLSDVSLLEEQQRAALNVDGTPISLRTEAQASADSVILLYIGNLEGYQGIDLLLQSFSIIAPQNPKALMVVIGGRDEHIAFYQRQAAALGCESQVRFLGPRPVSSLNDYLTQADILVSPRVKGNNTPMKIYSYLHSGRVVLATDLPTHSQVFSGDVAKLAPPDPVNFSKAMSELVSDESLRNQLGGKARALAERKFTFSLFSKSLGEIYDRVAGRLGAPQY